MKSVQLLEVQQRIVTTPVKNFPLPLERFLITAQGKYKQLNPVCPHCDSRDVVDNGSYCCEAQLARQLGLEVKHGHYLCTRCRKSFSTPFNGVQTFLQNVKTYLEEISFDLFMQGMSFGGIGNHLSDYFNMAVDAETVRRYYIEHAQECRNRKVPHCSGFFGVDCQHLKVNGQAAVRLSVIDVVTTKNIVDVRILAETNEEIVDRLRLFLLPYDVRGFVIDGKRGLRTALQEEYDVPVQLCLFHVQKLIIEDYRRKYGKKLSLLQTRNMYMELTILQNHDVEVQFLNRQLKTLDEFSRNMWCQKQELREKSLAAEERRLLSEFYGFRSSLQRCRRKNSPYLLTRTQEEMRQKLEEARLFLTEKHEKKRLDMLEKNGEALTTFLRVKQLPPTNNITEHYYAETLTKTDKKRFRSLSAISHRIAAARARWNSWMSPSVTLTDLMLQFAWLFQLFGKPH